MNATSARTETDRALSNAKASRLPNTLALIQDMSANGQSYLLASTTPETRVYLRSEGFKCIVLLGITLIRW